MAFRRFHRGSDGWRHPRSMGAVEVDAFLSHLAVERKVAAATQNQALNAIVFLYKQALEIDPGSFRAVRARPSRRLPTVLSRREVVLVINAIPPPIRLLAVFMYGGGLRVGEACSVRVTDLYLEHLRLTVRRGKGYDDRVEPRVAVPVRRGSGSRHHAADDRHVFRLSFAMHLLEDAYDIRTTQTLLGHSHVETKKVHTHVVRQSPERSRDRPSTFSLNPISATSRGGRSSLSGPAFPRADRNMCV